MVVCHSALWHALVDCAASHVSGYHEYMMRETAMAGRCLVLVGTVCAHKHSAHSLLGTSSTDHRSSSSSRPQQERVRVSAPCPGRNKTDVT